MPDIGGMAWTEQKGIALKKLKMACGTPLKKGFRFTALLLERTRIKYI